MNPHLIGIIIIRLNLFFCRSGLGPCTLTCTDSNVVLLTLPISPLQICHSKMCPFGPLATVKNVKVNRSCCT